MFGNQFGKEDLTQFEPGDRDGAPVQFPRCPTDGGLDEIRIRLDHGIRLAVHGLCSTDLEEKDLFVEFGVALVSQSRDLLDRLPG